MPVVKRFASKVRVYVYGAPGEHPPPHFHVVGPEIDIMVEIATLRVMEGRYRPREVAEALAWAAENKTVLMQTWERLNERD